MNIGNTSEISADYGSMIARYAQRVFNERHVLTPAERAELIKAEIDLQGVPSNDSLLNKLSDILEISDVRVGQLRETECGVDYWHFYGTD